MTIARRFALYFTMAMIALCQYPLSAQESMEARVAEYRKQIKWSVNSTLDAYNTWEKTLPGENRQAKLDAFENLRKISWDALVNLRQFEAIEGDTSYYQKASVVVYRIHYECSDRIRLITDYAAGYSRSEWQNEHFGDMQSELRQEFRERLKKMDWAEREMMANVMLKPTSADFCRAINAMIAETKQGFPNLKGSPRGSNSYGFERFDVTQLFIWSSQGALYLAEKNPYAEFLMAESQDSLEAINMMNNLASYVLCCEPSSWKRISEGTWMNDKAALTGLEYRMPNWEMEIVAALRRDDRYGPYQVYLQFRKLK